MSVWFKRVIPSFGAVGFVAAAAVLSVATVALADSGADHRTVQSRPSPLGVSGGSIEFLVINNNLYCYTGTFGASVEGDIDGFAGNEQFVLSNNHVLAKENNPDDTRLATDGYEMIQPGLLDEGPCTLSLGDPANIVADLTGWVEISFGRGKNAQDNFVDAAIAEVRTGGLADGTTGPLVVTDGYILDIGPVSGVPLLATVSLPVQKSGRTTGHTFGTVEAVMVDINVNYNSGKARFVDQIRIRGVCGTDFSAGGDSGSLIVNVPGDADRQAVGLLFAGGGDDTFANPIDTVLTELGMALGIEPLSMVDGGTSAQGQDDTANVPQCSEEPDEPTGSPGGGRGNGNGPPRGAFDPVGLEIAGDVKDRHSNELFTLPGVVGHGVGLDADGDSVIEVYVENASRRAAGRPIPSEIEGIPVRIVVTGPIRAF